MMTTKEPKRRPQKPGVFRNYDVINEYIEKSLNSDYVTDGDRALIKEYIAFLEKSVRIGVSTKAQKMHVLTVWKKFLPCEYSKVTVADLDVADDLIRVVKNCRGRPYRPNALFTMYHELRQFVRWLSYKKIIEVTSEDLKYHLKAPSYDPATEEAKDMLTVEEVAALIQAAENPRDKALIATVADSGARIHEVAALRWCDLKFEDEHGGVEVTLHDLKTNNNRVTWLSTARPFLAVWKAAYPGDTDGDNPVFTSFKARVPLSYNTLVKILMETTKRTCIKKRVHWHLLRKTRATAMAREGYSDNSVKLALWGRLSTKMQSVYVHLSGRDVINDFQRRSSGQDVQVVKPEPQTVRCIVCNEVNAVGVRTCIKCGRNPTGPVHPDAMLRNQIADALMEKPEVKALIEMMIAGSAVKIEVPIKKPGAE